MKITLKDGVVKEFDNAVSVLRVWQEMPAQASLTAK